MRIDGENRSRPCQQGNMEANGSEVAKVCADRGQCHFNSAPGRRVKPASKTGPRLVAPLERFPLELNHSVMAGLVPAIHAFLAAAQTWMPGTRPGMTEHVGQVEREPH